MKKNIILSAALMVAMTLTACHKAEKVAIEFSELPAAAQTFVQTHFADKQISIVYHDADGVPTAIIPAAINEYVAAKHAGQYVVQIGKDGKNYEVELNSTIEIVFDKNGNFLRYDD